MAVAADLHRDFLIPEQQGVRLQILLPIRVYSFVILLYHG